MTVAEQIAESHRKDRFARFGTWALGALALIVPVMAIVLAFNVAKTAAVTDTVDRELRNAQRSICLSRATTLRTAPLTVKEQRALNDALTPTAKKVCPDLDYADLERQRRREAALIKRGVDPIVLAVDEKE